MDNKPQESSMSSGQRNTSSSDNNDSSSNPISNELNSGMELARQLQRLLNDPNSQNMDQYYREQLVQGIISSFDRAVTIVQQTDQHLTSSNSMMIDSPNPPTGLHNMSGGGMGDAANSPPMVSGGGGSCMSESTVDHRSNKRVDPGESSSKLKSEKRWVNRVQSSSESGFEPPINEDGYNWRKYGQKEINGAKYQRGYYRCSLKSQGCNAKKQVQRCEEDNSIFLVTYRGQHTCQNYQSQVVHQPPNIIPSSPPSSSSGTVAPSNYPTYIPTNNHYNPNQRERLISFKTWPTQQQPQQQQQSNIYHNQFRTPQPPSSSLGTNNSVFFHGSSSNNPITSDLSVDQPLPALEPLLPSSARMEQVDRHGINIEHSAGQQLQQASQPQGDHLPAEPQPVVDLQAAETDYNTDYDNIFVRDFPFHHHEDNFDPSVFYH